MSLYQIDQAAILAAIAYAAFGFIEWNRRQFSRSHRIQLSPLPPAPDGSDLATRPKKFQRDADAFLVGIINLSKQLEELERQYHEQERTKESTRSAEG